MADSKPRTKVPETAKPGEIIPIKAVITHDMENGQRKDADGNLVPRKIINRFECAFDGAVFFSCDLMPSVSANPYFEFTMRAEKSGTVSFRWVDDDGTTYTDEKPLKVG